jgi:nitroimidazol reductase NimA-like FMN-containing flavoprotein (pyridoxamine 5'-phosphate oxidase superfamily)
VHDALVEYGRAKTVQAKDTAHSAYEKAARELEQNYPEWNQPYSSEEDIDPALKPDLHLIEESERQNEEE